MRKSDYMKLSKERLAELLEEYDMRDYIGSIGQFNPNGMVPCYTEGGYCTNPHGDCINCPRKDFTSGVVTSTETTAGFKIRKTSK